MRRRFFGAAAALALVMSVAVAPPARAATEVFTFTATGVGAQSGWVYNEGGVDRETLLLLVNQGNGRWARPQKSLFVLQYTFVDGVADSLWMGMMIDPPMVLTHNLTGASLDEVSLPMAQCDPETYECGPPTLTIPVRATWTGEGAVVIGTPNVDVSPGEYVSIWSGNIKWRDAALSAGGWADPFDGAMGDLGENHSHYLFVSQHLTVEVCHPGACPE